MELTDLKKTWDKLASDHELDEKQLKEMLSKRTKNLIERIDRNIKIGFAVLLVLFLVIALDNYLIAPLLLEDITLNIPSWLVFLEVFSNTLIFTTFIYFTIKYYLVKRSCDVTCNLKETLVKIIATLNLYKRLFYLALISMTFTMTISFITGLYQESMTEIEMQGVAVSEIQLDKLLLEIFVGLVFLVVVVGGIFVFLRWGFRRLYGNYYHKLNQTLKELNEIDE